jgi:hypothetical protein
MATNRSAYLLKSARTVYEAKGLQLISSEKVPELFNWETRRISTGQANGLGNCTVFLNVLHF